MLDKSTKKKEGRMCTIAISNAGMKQADIAGVLNVTSVVSRPLREWQYYKKETVILILECKKLLLKHYGMWCSI